MLTSLRSRPRACAVPLLALWLCVACGTGPDPVEGLTIDASAKPARREMVRAFYSGHSLTDGVPEEVAKIAAGLASQGKPGDFNFQFQSIAGSRILQRTRGLDPAQPGSGYRSGGNRNGQGLDVIAELTAPRTIGEGERYNALVVTERHDLIWTVAHDETVPALGELHDKFTSANPEGDVFLYHVWLEVGDGPAAGWVDYERAALPLWECVASAVNRKLPQGRKPVRVLPGATALAELVDSMLAGDAPGVTGTEAERMALIFSDGVHFADAGRYFMGLVHYAALFGVSPEGAPVPAGVSPELAAHMQRIAWQHVSSYAQRAASAASREAAFCSEYAADVMCPSYYQHRKPVGGGLVDRVKWMKSAWECGSSFDLEAPDNPFRE